MADTCCSDALNADIRALARACRTAARLPVQGERGRTIREAGEEGTSASPEFDSLIDSVAMLAESRTGRSTGGAGTGAAAGPLPASPLVLFGGIGLAILIAFVGVFMPGATPALPLPVDLARTAEIEDMRETFTDLIGDQAVQIAALETDAEGLRSDLDVVVGLSEEAVFESSRIAFTVENDVAELIEENADLIESNYDRIQNLTIQIAAQPR